MAGAVFPAGRPPELRCRVAAQVLDALLDRCAETDSDSCFAQYKKRSMVLGQRVTLLSPGGGRESAQVLDLDRDYALLVRLDDGSVHRVNSGEVSIRPAGL